METKASKIPYILVMILLLIISATFFRLTQTRPFVADPIGYILAGKALASGNGLLFYDSFNEIAGPFFGPFAFQIRHEGVSHLHLGFPPGLPILLAAGILLTGQTSFGFYVVPILAIITLLLTFMLGKFCSDNAWIGLVATILLALSPLLWLYGTDAWAAVPSTFCVLAGMLLYLGSRQKKRSLTQRIGISILAGVFLVFSLYIRYANITFLLAIGLTELLTVRWALWQEKWRWFFYLILGFGLLSILAFNHTYYGGITLTSYSPENGWYNFPPFSLAYMFGSSEINQHGLLKSLTTLWQNFPFILLLTPLGWFTLKRPYGLLFALCTLTSIGIYSIYAFSPEGINARFLLPIFPYVAISITSVLFYIGNKIHNTYVKTGLIATILVILVVVFIPNNVEMIQKRQIDAENGQNHLESWLKDTPENAVYLSYVMNDHIIYYGNRSVLNYRRIPQYDPNLGKIRHDFFEPCLVYLIDEVLANNTPVIYIEDGNPPLYNSFNRLQSYYQLEPIREDPKLHRVQWQGNSQVRGSIADCRP